MDPEAVNTPNRFFYNHLDTASDLDCVTTFMAQHWPDCCSSFLRLHFVLATRVTLILHHRHRVPAQRSPYWHPGQDISRKNAGRTMVSSKQYQQS